MPGETIFQYNNINYNELYIQNFNNTDFISKYNYWGPAATIEMSVGPELRNISTIHDYFDDNNLGTVDYSQFLDAPWPDGSPVFPDTTYITGGTISVDSTWSLARSPYVLSGDVVVTGATLNIEPGVEVFILPNQDNFQFNNGRDDSKTEIILWLGGNIIAQGTESDSIIFRAYGDNHQTNQWYGIYLAATEPEPRQTTFKHVVIEDAYHGIECDNQGLILENSRISNCDWGIQSHQGSAKTIVRNSRFYGNTHALNCYGDSLIVYGTFLSGNETGVRVEHDLNFGLIDSCSFQFNTYATNFNTVKQLSIIKNTFHNETDVWLNYYNEDYLLQNNNFNTQNSVYVNYYTNNILNAKENYWGESVYLEIINGDNPKNLSSIHDWFDDPQMGMVNYSHWLNAPWPNGQPVGNSYDAEFLISNNQFQEEMLTYHSGDSIFFQVTDIDRNTDDIVPESITIDVWSELEDTPETVTLNETDLASGIFQGFIKLDDLMGVPFTDGQLQVSHGDWMYFQYIDPANDWGNVDTSLSTILFNATIMTDPTYSLPTVIYESSSPYILLGSINAEDSLTIEPGVEIYFNSFGSITLQNSERSIYAIGTAQDSILFSSYQSRSSLNQWDKILTKNGVFSYCIFQNAGNSFSLNGTENDTVLIDNSSFQYCHNPIYIGNSSVHCYIDSISVEACNALLFTAGNVWITNSSFTRSEVSTPWSWHNASINIGENSNVFISQCDFSNINKPSDPGVGLIPNYRGEFYCNYTNFNDLQIAVDINEPSGNTFNCKYNYWGNSSTVELVNGTNPQNILAIQDYYDNPNRGTVNYSRWLDAPWPGGTPAPGGYTGELDLIYSDGTPAWGYNQGDTLFVQVYDPDLNLDINTPETAQVEVWSELETIPETLILTEIDADTGLYRGWLLFDDQTGFAMTDGVLQVDQGNQVWVQYTDAVDDWDNNNVTSTDSVLYNFRIREYEPDANTVLLLHFNEGEGQIVTDSSQYSNDGLLGSSASIENEDPIWTNDGISDHGIQFMENDKLTIPNSVSINLQNEFTFEAWSKLDSLVPGAVQNIVRKENSYFIQLHNNGTFNFGVWRNGNVSHHHFSNIDIVKDKWYHIAGVKTGNELKLFLDRELVATYDVSEIDQSTSDLKIGDPDTDEYLFGIIDEVRISNIARTSFDYEYTENPPGKINDLTIADSTSNSIQLSWHAPGADSYTGACDTYDLRMSTSPIDSANFASATPVSNLPTPTVAGSLQNFQVANLTYGTTYYFAIKTQDDEGLWSPISNIATGTTEPQDQTAPGVIADLTAGTVGKRRAVINWTAPADDDASGRPVQGYSIHYSMSTITEGNFFDTDSILVPAAALEPGTTQTDTITGLDPNTVYYTAVKSFDEVPNWSAISNVFEFTTGSVPVVAATPFPQNGYDAQHSRIAPHLGATLGNFRWSYATGGAVSSSPVIDGSGNVYFGSEDGKVYALDQAGNLLWNKNLGSGVFAAPTVGTDNHLFVACKNNKVYALNSTSGDTIWTYTTGNQVFSSPIVSSFGYLYAGSLDNMVYALSSDTGELLWTFTGSNRFYASPALTIDESQVIIGDQSGNLYAIDARNGVQDWVYPIGSAVYSNAAIDSAGKIYVGAQNGNLYAIDAAGSYLWDYNTGGAIFYASPTIEYAGTVTRSSSTDRSPPTAIPIDKNPDSKPVRPGLIKSLFSSNQGTRDKGRGTFDRPAEPRTKNKEPLTPDTQSLTPARRSLDAGGPDTRSLTPASIIYIGSDAGNFHAVDAVMGTNLWTYPTGGQVRNGAILSSNGYLYFGSADDSVYCIKNDGNRRWAYKTGGDIYTSNAAMGLD
ncbi:MAG: PQQ-binding-like beta-propeller repeat protein, partial [Candidatus Marinimicrobia bacterium]|nr:PQQ-binding-like beta-propeller repeat protein [Candidatus Neomarinimicrobiota bacterium]